MFLILFGAHRPIHSAQLKQLIAELYKKSHTKIKIHNKMFISIFVFR